MAFWNSPPLTGHEVSKLSGIRLGIITPLSVASAFLHFNYKFHHHSHSIWDAILGLDTRLNLSALVLMFSPCRRLALCSTVENVTAAGALE